jgi:transposase
MFKFFEHRCKYRARVEELEIRFSEMESRIGVLMKRVEQLEQENAFLKAENAELKTKLAKYEAPAKDSGNSSVSPSQDPHRKRAPKKEKGVRSAGGQKGHPGHHRGWSEQPDEIIPLHPETCAHCGSSHLLPLPEYSEARQEVELPSIQAHVREYQSYSGLCQHCGKRSDGVFPPGLKGPVQMGTGVDALVGYLKVIHHLSHDKIAAFFQDVLQIPLSHGGVQACLSRLNQSFQPTYQGLIEQCREQAVLHSDETKSRIGGKTAYLWTFVAQSLCVFVSDPSRGFQVIQRTIGDTFHGIWVSDRYNAQLKLAILRQLCLAHLIRDCEYLIEAERSRWGFRLQNLFRKAIHRRNQAGTAWNPAEPAIKIQIRQLNDQLERLFSKPPPQKHSHKLFRQLFKRKHQLLLFLEHPAVPPTNNEAERALRPYVLHRRMNGEFKSQHGAQGHACLQSVIETARRRGLHILQVLSHKQALTQPA